MTSGPRTPPSLRDTGGAPVPASPFSGGADPGAAWQVRCPQCATTFRVSAAALQQRAGWVRCGVCDTAFDTALARLAGSAAAAPAHVPASASASAPASAPTPAPVPRAPAWGDVQADALAPLPADRAEPVARRSAEPVSVWVETPAPAAAASAGPWTARGEPDWHIGEPVANAAWSARDEDLPPAALPTRRPPRAAGWGLLVLLGLVILVAQAGYWWRDHLATVWPGLRPVLTAACEPLGCTVGYLRDPEQFSLQSTSLQADGDGLRLEALLRNGARHAQPWPTLELTLTDAAERVLVRRVVPPADYLPASVAAAAMPGQSERVLRMSVALAPDLAVSGYQLLLFFP